MENLQNTENTKCWWDHFAQSYQGLPKTSGLYVNQNILLIQHNQKATSYLSFLGWSSMSNMEHPSGIRKEHQGASNGTEQKGFLYSKKKALFQMSGKISGKRGRKAVNRRHVLKMEARNYSQVRVQVPPGKGRLHAGVAGEKGRSRGKCLQGKCMPILQGLNTGSGSRSYPEAWMNADALSSDIGFGDHPRKSSLGF